jgi:hypothetical protein
LSLSDDTSDGVLIKGKLGELLELSHEEGLMVEIIGNLGVLRLDLDKDELRKLFKKNEVRARNYSIVIVIDSFFVCLDVKLSAEE